jgi:hypothetical protein
MFASLLFFLFLAIPARACPPVPSCLPPIGCTFDGPILDAAGCEIGCGNLVCVPVCPLFLCAAPVTGCTYGKSELDENGCATGCGPLVCDDIVCPADAMICPDGSSVGRDPAANCKFKPCPKKEPKCCDPLTQPGFGSNPICFEGAQCCPDGQWSCSIGDGRSFPCGGEIITTGFGVPCDVPIVCTDDVQACPDGSSVSRNPKKNCQFDECNPIFCTDDVKTCPNGSFVARNPDLGCTFDPCPALDCQTCPFGFFDGCNTCGCTERREVSFCTLRACGPDNTEEQRCNPAPTPKPCLKLRRRYC